MGKNQGPSKEGPDQDRLFPGSLKGKKAGESNGNLLWHSLASSEGVGKNLVLRGGKREKGSFVRFCEGYRLHAFLPDQGLKKGSEDSLVRHTGSPITKTYRLRRIPSHTQREDERKTKKKPGRPVLKSSKGPSNRGLKGGGHEEMKLPVRFKRGQQIKKKKRQNPRRKKINNS